MATIPRCQRALSAIEAATKRGASLTSQLLTFARRQSVNPQAVDVAERIDAVREVLDTAVGSAVTLQFDVARGVWPVMVDVAEFETALVNLVINARDAMTGGGVITISAHNDTSGDEAGAGGHVAISVEDTGAGIAPDILGKIFDPFFTTKPIGKGTGLGLSQVHGFAHQAGGTVKVASELGKGTRITILLPRKEAAPAAEEVRMPSKPAAAAPCCWSRTIRMSQPSAPACSNSSATPSAGWRMPKRPCAKSSSTE